jgi:hypothetical protein
VLVSLNLSIEINCLRFYGSDAKCESAPCYVQHLGRACVARWLQIHVITASYVLCINHSNCSFPLSPRVSTNQSLKFRFRAYRVSESDEPDG